MTHDELNTALLKGRPVILKIHLLGDVYFDRVSGVHYGVKDGKLTISAVLKNDSSNYVTNADPKMVRYATADETAEYLKKSRIHTETERLIGNG